MANGARVGERAPLSERALVDPPAHALTKRLCGAIEALARTGDDRLAPRQGASERAQVAAKAVGKAQDRAPPARVQVGNRGEELGPDGHREFGRRGWRGRAHVRRVIDQRPVSLVADGGDERNRAASDRAHHGLVVEAHEVFERAAAARDNEHVRTRSRSRRRPAH